MLVPKYCWLVVCHDPKTKTPNRCVRREISAYEHRAIAQRPELFRDYPVTDGGSDTLSFKKEQPRESLKMLHHQNLTVADCRLDFMNRGQLFRIKVKGSV